MFGKKNTTKEKEVVTEATVAVDKTIKTLSGVVVSDAMDKTVVVKVDRFVKHPKYKKFYTVSKKVKAHDAENTYKVGDKVNIVASRPMSKSKSFTVVGLVETK